MGTIWPSVCDVRPGEHRPTLWFGCMRLKPPESSISLFFILFLFFQCFERSRCLFPTIQTTKKHSLETPQIILLINWLFCPSFITMTVCYLIVHNNTHNNTHNHKSYPTPNLIRLIFWLNLNSFKKVKSNLIPNPNSFKKPNPPKHVIKENRRRRPKHGNHRNDSIGTCMDRCFRRCEGWKWQKTLSFFKVSYKKVL